MTAPLDVHGVFIGIDGFEIRNTLMKMLKEFPGGIAGRRLLSFFESIEHENWMLRAKLRWLMRGSGEEEEEERQTNILVTRVWERDEDLGNVKGTQTENEEEKRNVFDVSVETNSEEVEEILYAEKRRVEFPGRMIDSVTQTEDNKMDGNILEEKLEGKGKEKNKIELMKNDMEIEGIMVELGSAEKLEKINAEMTKELEKNRKKLEEEFTTWSFATSDELTWHEYEVAFVIEWHVGLNRLICCDVTKVMKNENCSCYGFCCDKRIIHEV
ncbi:hypothetical protein Pmar_PMAR022301 [Perkinsus marinus ATCC 50983]|uniref:Uncharacterized protein n=1 Tax=Perkinsus marinus (strain ATCC 50983 / TXsc) TaxID=423536 RepID=C5KDQ3_PERM5|nr:hypothetical protein Pmar_PMAR022301 [Perkinsus marinus ATCC 50983]EER17356.1 hypothetical protein Pmar_PMAR022301 [Perkinsus marinus ATCC 50983]|eukprot:XP_002785560.1 hypothetical protein Pmar_PMAR022301 [Perkinsus marinus ATCC 50983]